LIPVKFVIAFNLIAFILHYSLFIIHYSLFIIHYSLFIIEFIDCTFIFNDYNSFQILYR